MFSSRWRTFKWHWRLQIREPNYSRNNEVNTFAPGFVCYHYASKAKFLISHRFFFWVNPVEKRYTIVSAVLRQQMKSDVMTYFGLTARSAAYYTAGSPFNPKIKSNRWSDVLRFACWISSHLGLHHFYVSQSDITCKCYVLYVMKNTVVA
jgi:hypothetical protein